jgi:hypothetical protein
MKSRIEKFKKNKTSKRAKFLVGTLFLSIGVCSSISVAFANQDIESLLVNWFAKQKTESVETIEKSIMSEKEVQMQRLKEELQIEIRDAKQQLDQFTEEEKEKRIIALKTHTDDLIKNIKIDDSAEREAVINELNKIENDAIDKMNEVSKSKNLENEQNKTIEAASGDNVEGKSTKVNEVNNGNSIKKDQTKVIEATPRDSIFEDPTKTIEGNPTDNIGKK